MCFDSWAQGFICEEELIRYISLSLCVSVMELQATVMMPKCAVEEVNRLKGLSDILP